MPPDSPGGRRFRRGHLVAASRRQPRRERLELLSNLANGSQISRIHPRDEHAAPRVDVDEVLGRQRPNRLADRRSPHAQLLAQFGLADDRPGSSSAVQIMRRTCRYAWSARDSVAVVAG